MQIENPDIDTGALGALIKGSYGLPVEALTFVPVGECSYDYVAHTAGGDVFVKIHTDTPAARDPWVPSELERRLRVAAALRYDAEIVEVVAPLPARDGRYVVDHPVGPLAVFPYVRRQWLRPETRTVDDVRAAGRLLAVIHTFDVAGFGDAAPIETYEIEYADMLRCLLADVDASDQGCGDEATRDLLRRHRHEILEALAQLERLQAAARQLAVAAVVTHGDPNQANFLKLPDGALRLVDWDSAALGPAERDLVFFAGDQFSEFMAAYASVRGTVTLHPEVVTFYLYHWDLQEIADYGTRLLRLPMSAAERQRCWEELTQYLPIRHEEITATARDMWNARVS